MKIGVTLDDGGVQATFNRLIRDGNDLTPLMHSIGEFLVRSTKRRFVDERDPDGRKWADLSETTKSRKKRHPDKVGTEYGNLSGGINFRAGRDFVEVGSPEVYAGTFHFGARQGEFGVFSIVRTRQAVPIPWGDIPARNFLGLSDTDERRIEDEIIAFITEPWELADRSV